jgi:hypothetical protein
MIELEMTQAFAEDGRLLNASSRAMLGVNVDRTIFRIQVGVRNLSKINDFILHWQTKNWKIELVLTLERNIRGFRVLFWQYELPAEYGSKTWVTSWPNSQVDTHRLDTYIS